MMKIRQLIMYRLRRKWPRLCFMRSGMGRAGKKTYGSIGTMDVWGCQIRTAQPCGESGIEAVRAGSPRFRSIQAVGCRGYLLALAADFRAAVARPLPRRITPPGLFFCLVAPIDTRTGAAISEVQ